MKIWWDLDQYGDWVRQKLKKYVEEEREVIDKLKSTDTDSLKPIDALVLLNELKDKLGE